MKLFTKEILKKLPGLDESADWGLDKLTVHLKLFNPAGVGTWYIYAYDPADKMAMAFVNLDDPDMSDVELEGLSLPMGLSIERDTSFESVPLNEVIDKIKSGGHVADSQVQTITRF